MTKANEISIPTRNLDTIQAPTAGQPLSVYLAFMQMFKADAGAWDRGKGRLSYLQGTALLHARKVCQESGEVGAWGAFLGKIGMKDTTAKYLRKIATDISEKESHTLGFSEMLARCYKSYANKVKAEVAEEDGTKPKRTRKSKSSPLGEVAPVDPQTLGVWTVNNLTNVKGALQKTADQVTDRDLPDDFDENRYGHLRTLIEQAETELARIRKTVDKWESILNRGALVLGQSERQAA
jgi:hypothetical protein